MFTIRKHYWHLGIYFAHTRGYVCSGACVCTHIHAFYFVLLSPHTPECVNISCTCFRAWLFKSCVALHAEEDRCQGSNKQRTGSLFWEDCELFWQFQVHFCLDQGKRAVWPLGGTLCLNSSENKEIIASSYPPSFCFLIYVDFESLLLDLWVSEDWFLSLVSSESGFWGQCEWPESLESCSFISLFSRYWQMALWASASAWVWFTTSLEGFTIFI